MCTSDRECHLKVKAGDIYHTKCLVMDGQNYVGMRHLMEEICSQQCMVPHLALDLAVILRKRYLLLVARYITTIQLLHIMCDDPKIYVTKLVR